MNEQNVDKELLQWHQAFYAGLQIELEAESDKLVFENEHHLGSKPMEIDVLVIKKDSSEPIRKNIGRIFRKYNIIEYKSPEDYLSIDDFYKVYGYCCFYKADVPNVNSIKVDELTITFVCSKYPGNVIKHLQRVRGYIVEQVVNGIYQIYGDIISIQIIITKQLSREENLWLKSLTDKLKRKDIFDGLLDSYKENCKNPLYESMMNIIIRANPDAFKEVKGVCEALEELFKDIIDERVKEQVEVKVKEQVEAKVKEQVAVKVKEQIELERIGTMNRINELIVTLSKLGRLEDVVKAAENKEYQQKLFEEFGL